MLQVEAIESGGQVVIAPCGDLDERKARMLGDRLRAAQSQATPVVLDLRLVSSMDIAALWTIADADQRARVRGSRLRVIPGSPQVQAALERTGLDARVRFVRPTEPMS